MKRRPLPALGALVFLLVAAIIHTALHDGPRAAPAKSPAPRFAPQVIASPPQIIRIESESAYVRRPDGSIVELPSGSEFAANSIRYDLTARVNLIHATAEIFRDEFEH